MNRQRRPLTWLGALLFGTFLLPTLGLAPFAYQAYSTVADRYAYLALIGVGLMVADTVDRARRQKLAMRGAATAFIALAALSFSQSRTWLTSADLLHHTIDVNPAAAFAYNNLGDAALANGDLADGAGRLPGLRRARSDAREGSHQPGGGLRRARPARRGRARASPRPSRRRT